jgi:hypothetical protein
MSARSAVWVSRSTTARSGCGFAAYAAAAAAAGAWNAVPAASR